MEAEEQQHDDDMLEGGELPGGEREAGGSGNGSGSGSGSGRKRRLPQHMEDYQVYNRALRPQLNSPAAQRSGVAAAVTACATCGSDQDEPGRDDILLCDACDAGYHMHCLRPPLLVVPAGDWFCAQCASQRTAGRGAAGAAAGASTALGAGAAEGGSALVRRGDVAGASAALSAVVVSEFDEDAVKVEAVMVDLEGEEGEEGLGVEVEVEAEAEAEAEAGAGAVAGAAAELAAQEEEEAREAAATARRREQRQALAALQEQHAEQDRVIARAQQRRWELEDEMLQLQCRLLRAPEGDE